MKKQTLKIIVFISFFILFLGSAGIMYYKYVYNQPKIKIIAPKTDYDPIKVDSALRSQKGYKR